MKKLLIVFFAAAAGIQLCVGSTPEVTGEEDVQSRIIGGMIASDNQFPYSASLQHIQFLSQPSRGHTCGGALITLRHVITAGSCLFQVNATGAYVQRTPAQYRVFAGRAILTNDNSVDSWRGVAAFTPHPSYAGPPSHVNDVGVITLSSAFPSNLTGLAPLAVTTTMPADGSLCISHGWGSTYTGVTASPYLMFTYRHTLPQAACGQMSVSFGGPAIQPHMMCAQFATHYTPSCTYDTGNALVCGGALVGVLSWYAPCSYYTYVEVYTRSGSFANWLSTVTSAAPVPTPAATLLILAAAVSLARLFNSTSQ